MNKLLSGIATLVLALGALAANAADSLDGEATQVYRISLEINAHPSEVLPTLLNKKLWLEGYVSLAHLAGKRWEIGEVVEIVRRANDITTVQREEIIELEWEQRLTLKLSSGAQKGLAFYEIEPTPKGVQLSLLLALTNQRPDMTMRRSDVAKRLRYESTLQQLKIEHRRLKRVLELKSLTDIKAPAN
jgi:hypothetical protein